MSLAQEITAIDGCLFSADQDLTAYTTMKLASHGDLVEVKSVKALQKLLPLLNKQDRKYLVVGWGANQISPPRLPGLDYLPEPRFRCGNSANNAG